MYNRYIRNDHGTYTRIEEPEHTSTPTKPEAGEKAPPPSSPPPHRTDGSDQETRYGNGTSSSSGRFTDGLTGFLRHILEQLHLDHVDTGDLLLLGLLFLLSREDADEELLIALGLLLIL